jgi:glycine oxidase
VEALARAAAKHGARIEAGEAVEGLVREGQRVVGVETRAGSIPAGRVVLCAGSWTPACAAGTGAAVPVTPVRGQIVSLADAAPPLRAILWGAGAYLVPKRDGSVVVGATVERVGFDRRVTAAGVRELLEAAFALAPGLACASFREAWAGLRPDTPDHLPLIGPVPGVPGLVLAAGHYRNGVLLAPATGELVADGVLGRGWSEPAFLPERFSGATG